MLLSIVTIIVVFISLHLTAKVAGAANADFYDTKTGVVYKASEYRTDSAKFNELVYGLGLRGDEFVYENGSKGFNYEKLLNSITTKMGDGKDLVTAFGECIVDQTIQVAIPAPNTSTGDTFEVSSIE